MRIGDIMHDGKNPWLITDIYKKKKSDSIVLYDDEFNNAKSGQIFIYAVNVCDNCTTKGREIKETFIRRMKFLGKIKKTPCCNKWHVDWNFWYRKLNERSKEIKELEK